MPKWNAKRRQSIERRFYSSIRIADSGCWEWQKAIGTHGYGVMGISGYSVETTHRVSWLLHCGDIPPQMFVLHKCDNRKCCNPLHLYLGTVKDNSRDLWKRGKPFAKIHLFRPAFESKRIQALPRGAKHHRSGAKLTEAQVITIRNMPGNQRAIANQFGVSQQLVSKIKTNQYWRHLYADASERVLH